MIPIIQPSGRLTLPPSLLDKALPRASHDANNRARPRDVQARYSCCWPRCSTPRWQRHAPRTARRLSSSRASSSYTLGSYTPTRCFRCVSSCRLLASGDSTRASTRQAPPRAPQRFTTAAGGCNACAEGRCHFVCASRWCLLVVRENRRLQIHPMFASLGIEPHPLCAERIRCHAAHPCCTGAMTSSCLGGKPWVSECGPT